uniref:BTB domain-containing protein n=1 Tax=Steinernema glaseri TaxID=37863 RepID=A0A1I8AQN1_9BILA
MISCLWSNMANIGKITGTLVYRGTSEEVEIAGTKWSLYNSCPSFTFRCAVDGENVLWSCAARGRITAWDLRTLRDTKMYFDCMNTKDGYACNGSDFFAYNQTIRSFEADIEVINIRRIDLSSPSNEAIDSPEDAACLEVEGKKLWVSKKTLSLDSPVFKTMFSGDSKEKATGCYALEEVKMDDLKLFLCVLYNLDITVRKEEFLEGLLRLGDKYQCDRVLRFCRIVGCQVKRQRCVW